VTVIDWLFDSDPSIRWQVMRDLTGAPTREVAAERARVATEGLGARLLALQADDGRWGSAAWNRGWNSTMHVLMLLRDLGLDPAGDQARRAVGIVRDRVTLQGCGPQECDGNAFFEGEVEPCINGQVAVVGAYFGQSPALRRGRMSNLGSGDTQLNLCATIELAPYFQLAAYNFGPFLHSVQAPVSSAAFVRRNL
jgi:hypothetical protein